MGPGRLTTYCCDTMRFQAESSCDLHPDRFECPDDLIHYSPRFREFGIIVHDGGTSTVKLDFCPWCGAELPASMRDRWLEAVRDLGLDPWVDDVPDRYRTDEWWRALDA